MDDAQPELDRGVLFPRDLTPPDRPELSADEPIRFRGPQENWLTLADVAFELPLGIFPSRGPAPRGLIDIPQDEQVAEQPAPRSTRTGRRTGQVLNARVDPDLGPVARAAGTARHPVVRDTRRRRRD